MPIPESFIQTLTDRADIVEVVSKYVKLKKSGNNYFGLCPFHGEKTPSFSVAPDKQIFHCFGCGEGGGAIGFIMKIESLNFAEAVKFLADLYGMEVPEDGTDRQMKQRRERMLALNKDAARYFHTVLLAEEGKAALQYLLGRGLSPKTITNFGLGFAPNGWDGLTNAMTKLGYSKSELLELGLVSKNNSGGVYDRFRNRVMFPIIDVRGAVIAFGGRVMDDSLPKYINSSDTPVYNKSRNLFAANIAKKTKRKNFILAEGYMDVISLHQAGFDNAVASLGTAFTPDQAKLILRYVEEVVICYDGDEAGQKATARAMDILNKNAITVRVLKLPGAKDPDEYIKKNGAENFEQLLERPQMGNEYSLSVIRGKYDLVMDDEKIAYMKEAVAFIASISSEVEREIYARNVAGELGVSYTSVLAESEKVRKNKVKSQEKSYQRQSLDIKRNLQPKARELKYENVKSALCEEKLLALVLMDDEYLNAAIEKITPTMFSSPFLGKIYQDIIEKYTQHDSVNLAMIVNFLEPVEAAHLTAVCTGYHKSGDGMKELKDYMSVIQTEYLKKNEGAADALLEIIKKKRSGENGN